MHDAFVVADSIVSPLGFSTAENIDALKNSRSGIRQVDDPAITPLPLWASRVDPVAVEYAFADLGLATAHTPLEKLMILSIHRALEATPISCADADTLIVLSTIKGNIDLLAVDRSHGFDAERINLWKTAIVIQAVFGASQRPVVVSNACISGVLAIILAARFVQTGRYRTVIVCGGDILSEFVVSGFQSLHALSERQCRPFDRDRSGLSLGEAAGTIVLTSDRALASDQEPVCFAGGATSNDANHISGTSRTGEGLYRAIRQTMKEARGHGVLGFDHLSAHGTATLFNDESEAIAIQRAGLDQVPMNSLKGYWGHTLGAAGVLESIATVRSLRGNFLLNTLGYAAHGVSKPLNIITGYREQPLRSALKTASGFGGCNAAVAFAKRA